VRGMAACRFTLTAEYLSGAGLRGRVGRNRHRRPLFMRTIFIVGLTATLALGRRKQNGPLLLPTSAVGPTFRAVLGFGHGVQRRDPKSLVF
jgi:hypothetical protein